VKKITTSEVSPEETASKYLYSMIRNHLCMDGKGLRLREFNLPPVVDSLVDGRNFWPVEAEAAAGELDVGGAEGEGGGDCYCVLR
jgi:hypothetical protein